MSVLDDVLSQAGNHTGRSTRVYSGEVSKVFLDSVVNEVNANYKPKSGRISFHFIYRDKYPVGTGVLGKYGELVFMKARKFLSGSIGYYEDVFPEDCRKFRICISADDTDVEEFLENMKPYILPTSSVELIAIDVSYSLDK